MKLYVTHDIIASVHKMHAAFTHVALNVAYMSIRPGFLHTAKIQIKPAFTYAAHQPATAPQLGRWKANGGLLLDRNPSADTIGEKVADAVAMAECPFTSERLRRAVLAAREQVVIPVPHTWRLYEETIDVRKPPVDELKAIWALCRGERMTDEELEEATGIVKSRLRLMRAQLKPSKEWELHPMLEPDNPGLLPAWAWVGAGRMTSRKEIRLAGHLPAVEEMARLGHITLVQRNHFDKAEPYWPSVERHRAEAIADLGLIRALVESLPDHLQAG